MATIPDTHLIKRPGPVKAGEAKGWMKQCGTDYAIYHSKFVWSDLRIRRAADVRPDYTDTLMLRDKRVAYLPEEPGVSLGFIGWKNEAPGGQAEICLPGGRRLTIDTARYRIYRRFVDVGGWHESCRDYVGPLWAMRTTMNDTPDETVTILDDWKKPLCK